MSWLYEEISMGLKTSIITHTNKHVVTEHTANVEVSGWPPMLSSRRLRRTAIVMMRIPWYSVTKKVHSVGYDRVQEDRECSQCNDEKTPGKV